MTRLNLLMTTTIQALKRAVSIAEKIQQLEAELAGILGQVPKASKAVSAAVVVGSIDSASATGRKKPRFSKASRAAISAAQKARWAKQKGKKSKPAAAKVKAKAKKKRGKMSAAGRANIVRAQKARWAKIKAEKAKKV